LPWVVIAESRSPSDTSATTGRVADSQVFQPYSRCAEVTHVGDPRYRLAEFGAACRYSTGSPAR
jgi:hypothetical protein